MAMHLDPRFGETANEVRAGGWPVAAEVACTPEGDDRVAMASALGVALERIAPVIAAERPDWLVVLGDRGEQAAAALAALHLGVGVAHLHGGEVTRGAVDDALRDIISRVAHLHLVATAEARARLLKTGEEAWRIRIVGAPGLDLLEEESRGDLAALRTRYRLGTAGYLVVLQHPETVGDRDPSGDLIQTLDAVRAVGLPAVGLFPNADAGGRAMASTLMHAPHITAIESLPRREFVTLLAGAAAIVGNSSSGIIEAPFLGVPAVNVGDRQAGRTRGDNVIDVANDRRAIEAAIRTAVRPAFRASLSGTSPYGDGAAAPRIIDALIDARLTTPVLMKRAEE
jgi:UDP-hydrolysing UDP-N-acetyl-D-glucosamine 2-epimerase